MSWCPWMCPNAASLVLVDGTGGGAGPAHPLGGRVCQCRGGRTQRFWGKDRWEEIIRINLTGTYNTLMACKPHLDAAPGVTHALVTSSVLGAIWGSGSDGVRRKQNEDCWDWYEVSWPWNGLHKGLMVNALCPGWVDTEMAQNSIQAMADAQGISYEACQSAAGGTSCLQDVSARPEEMAQWVDFLFSGLGKARRRPRWRHSPDKPWM